MHRKHFIPKNQWNDILASNELLNAARLLISAVEGNIESTLDGKVLIVGGAPRDILLGKPINDVDLATNIPLKEVAHLLGNGSNISKNDSQPVWSFKFLDHIFEIAQFREDDGGVRSENISTVVSDFETDTKRRDFTINALGLDSNGVIHDFQGGIEDLENHLIRAVGDPKKRFAEDTTRILRAMRFAALLDFDIEEKTDDAMFSMARDIMDRSKISMESISQEIFKTAKRGIGLANFMRTWMDWGLIEELIPEMAPLDCMFHDTAHHPEGNGNVWKHILLAMEASSSKDPVHNIALLLHDVGKAVTHELKGDDAIDGRPLSARFHGHEGDGVPIAEAILIRMKFNKLSSQDKNNILFAVKNHMLAHNMRKLKPSRLEALVNDEGWETLKTVALADGSCRFLDDASKARAARSVLEDFIWAETKIKKIGDKKKFQAQVSLHINGGKLLSWFPALEGPQIGAVLKPLKEHATQLVLDGSPKDDANMARLALEKIQELGNA